MVIQEHPAQGRANAPIAPPVSGLNELPRNVADGGHCVHRAALATPHHPSDQRIRDRHDAADEQADTEPLHSPTPRLL